MGICESKGNNEANGSPKTEQPIKLENRIPGHPMYPFKPLEKVARSVCMIISSFKSGSGFLIKFFQGEKDFYCLMTNEHVVTKAMVANKNKIDVYYDKEEKNKEIFLNSKERFIKDFKDITIDATVIEILPEDNIPNDLFLLPQKEFRDNYDKLIGEDITILQYPKGEMNYADGKILERTTLERARYEFVHDASTDEGSSGSPIVLKGTTKVIGIHKGGSGNKDININYGDFIWPIFCYFKNFQENKVNVLNDNYLNKETNNEINLKNILDTRNNVNVINNIDKNNNKNVFGLIHDNPLEDKLSQMTIIYNIQSYDNSIKLFGNDFVKNNINNCYLLKRKEGYF